MKKVWLWLSIVIVLAIVAWWLMNRDQGKSFSDQKSNYAFTIEDTASIGKVIIKDKTPLEVTLIRTNKGWMVDGEYPVRGDAMEVLMETFARMSMRNFAPQSTHELIMRRMATQGREVIVLDREGNEIKHFFVGENTPDDLGTYMMMEGGDQPYAVHIQGFNGFLSTRFFPDPILWRDRTIWGYDNQKIDSVSVTYSQSPESSFRIKVDEEGNAQLFDIRGTSIPFDTTKVRMYLGIFRTLKFEGAIVESDKVWNKKDSISGSVPVVDMYVHTFDGRSKRLTGHHVPAGPEHLGPDDQPLKWDPDRLYAVIDDGRFVLIQYFGMQNALVAKQHFMSTKG
ncbi:MAG: DUF4340 domain-containing protein [Bacteroidota bacterium]|nr:DUF4340 domain-containing protein [Bacteroidota bacterium]